MMRRAGLWVLMLLLLTAVTTAEAGEVYISEYVDGAGLKKRGVFDLAIELYNATGVNVDLAADGYAILIFIDGSLTPTYQIDLSGVVEAGGTFVLANSGAHEVILALADQVDPNLLFNGNDAIVLVRSLFRSSWEYLDIVGQVGYVPASGCWCYPEPTCSCDDLLSTADATLRRSIDYLGGLINPSDPFSFDPNVWKGFEVGTWWGLGHPGWGPLFADGFESGDFSTWTSASPAEASAGGKPVERVFDLAPNELEAAFSGL